MADELRFDGRVAIVTGGGRGMGRAHAMLLASRGASVVVNDLDTNFDGTLSEGEHRAADVAAEIEAAGGTAIADTHSVSTTEGGEALVAAAVEAFGRVDIVVHNAGHRGFAPFPEVTDDNLTNMLAVNVGGTYSVGRPAWRLMEKQGFGRFVLIASHSTFGSVHHSTYVAAKAALFGLVRGLAAEAAGGPIAVNGVMPVARTPGNDFIEDPNIRLWFDTHMKSEFTSAVVGYLAHDSCTLSGEILTAAGGRVGRIRLCEVEGYYNPALTIDDVAAHVSEFMSDAEHYTPATMNDALALNRRSMPFPGGG